MTRIDGALEAHLVDVRKAVSAPGVVWDMLEALSTQSNAACRAERKVLMTVSAAAVQLVLYSTVLCSVVTNFISN